MNLYELKEAYQNIQQLIEDGGDYEEALSVIDDAIEDKADGYARVIRNMEGDIEAFKTEEKRLADKRRSLENAVDRLKKNLFEAMKETGKEKFKTDLFSFAIQKNGGALPVIVDVPTDGLPDDMVIISEKPDLKAIAAYIEATGDVTYAHFGERGESLRIK